MYSGNCQNTAVLLFSISLTNQKIAFLLCNSASVGLYAPPHVPPPPKKRRKKNTTTHTTTVFFQLNWFWLLPSPNPKLFKDWNENIIFKCTVCFDPSPIWPVSLSPADIQYSEFTVKLLFTHTWSICEGYCKIRGYKESFWEWGDTQGRTLHKVGSWGSWTYFRQEAIRGTTQEKKLQNEVCRR